VWNRQPRDECPEKRKGQANRSVEIKSWVVVPEAEGLDQGREECTHKSIKNSWECKTKRRSKERGTFGKHTWKEEP